MYPTRPLNCLPSFNISSSALSSPKRIMVVRYMTELVCEFVIMLVMMKVGKSLGKRRYRV